MKPYRNRVTSLVIGSVLILAALLRCSPPRAPRQPVFFTPVGGAPAGASSTSTPVPTAGLKPPSGDTRATATAYAKLPGGQLVPQIPLVPADQIGQQYPGLSGHVLYTDFEGIWDYTIGGEVTKIFTVEKGGYLISASWSPDRSQVAFSYVAPTADGNFALSGSDIYLMNADGSNVRKAIVHDDPSSNLDSPTWSPDGKWLYFGYADYFRSADSYTYTVRLDRAAPDGSKRAVVGDSSIQPSVSADGRLLAFVYNDSKNFAQSLWVSNADGSQARPVVTADKFYALNMPRFSPDGKSIVFAASGAMGLLPSSSRAPGGGGSGWFEPPAAEAHGLPWDLYIVNVDGTGLKQLTNLGEDQPSAAFTNDGRYITFLGIWGIYIMKPDGSLLQKLSDKGGHGSLDWRP
jgi:Tol biopolymer transport system component